MRFIPPSLNNHLQGSVTTTCLLLQIQLESGERFGMTTHDRPIAFDGLTYNAGFDPSIIASSSDFKVGNGEARALLTQWISQNPLLNGYLDNAQWKLHLINWQQPDADNALLLDAGDIGDIKTKDSDAWSAELLSHALRLRQNIGGSWSRSCRAVFGSPADAQTGCGASAPFAQGVVTAVDSADRFRVFQSDIDTAAYGLGRVVWLSGGNAGQRLHRVEAADSGTVALFDAQRLPIQIGDTFKIRKDCNKSPSDCLKYGNLLNYKGEPYIPVGDGLESMTPSAQVFGGLNGSSIQP